MKWLWNDYRWNDYRWNDYRWNDYRWNDCTWKGVCITLRSLPATRALRSPKPKQTKWLMTIHIIDVYACIYNKLSSSREERQKSTGDLKPFCDGEAVMFPLWEVSQCEYKLATLAFCHLNSSLPPYLSSSLTIYQPLRSLHPSAEQPFKRPKKIKKLSVYLRSATLSWITPTRTMIVQNTQQNLQYAYTFHTYILTVCKTHNKTKCEISNLHTPFKHVLTVCKIHNETKYKTCVLYIRSKHTLNVKSWLGKAYNGSQPSFSDEQLVCSRKHFFFKQLGSNAELEYRHLPCTSHRNNRVLRADLWPCLP